MWDTLAKTFSESIRRSTRGIVGLKLVPPALWPSLSQTRRLADFQTSRLPDFQTPRAWRVLVVVCLPCGRRQSLLYRTLPHRTVHWLQRPQPSASRPAKVPSHHGTSDSPPKSAPAAPAGLGLAALRRGGGGNAVERWSGRTHRGKAGTLAIASICTQSRQLAR